MANKGTIVVISMMLLSAFASVAVAKDLFEDDFYIDKIDDVSQALNVVKQFKATPNDGREDTKSWQKAIDAATALSSGGKVVIPGGTYILDEIHLKSNVHLVFEKGVILKPTGNSEFMFKFGYKTERIENISFRCTDGRLTIDLRGLPRLSRFSPMMCSNMSNFLLSDMDFLDNYTVFSCLRFVTTRLGDQPYFATKGVIKNINLVSEGHIGYGTVQTQIARDLYFENIEGTGGVTLRMESGAGGDITPLTGTLFNITARDIKCTNGNAAVMISPHTRINGKVFVDGVTGYSCASAVRIDQGDTRNGPEPGRFSDGCVVRNVTAYYGTTAQIKNGRQHYIPVSLQPLMSRERGPESKSWVGPACAAVIDTAKDSVDGKFVVKFENVKQHGFEYQNKTVLIEADRNMFRVKND